MRRQSLGAGLLAGTQSALAPFELYRPRGAEEAVAAFRSEPGATLLAGATDLMGQIREGLSPRVVIALSGVPAWRDVTDEGDALRIGALATHHSGPLDPVLRRRLPALAAAWAGIATTRIRARATLGGNLMARQCRYETPVMLSALGARLELSGHDGEYQLSPRELWPALAPAADETAAGVPTPGLPAPGVLHHVRVPLGGLLLFAYERSMRPWLTVGLAVRAQGSGLRLTACIGSEYHPPVTVHAGAGGQRLRDLDPAGAGQALAEQLPDSVGDYAGSAAYRRRVTAVLVRRQLTAAAGQHEAGGQP
jgi:carbon-monoxide dehydrogenase medium subunit